MAFLPWRSSHLCSSASQLILSPILSPSLLIIPLITPSSHHLLVTHTLLPPPPLTTLLSSAPSFSAPRALSEIDARRAAGTSFGIVKELEPPARRVLKRLELEDKLEEATEARAKEELVAAVGEAEAMGAVVSDQLRQRFDAVLAAAKAMVDKLAAFETCKGALDGKDADGLKTAIGAVQAGWWKEDFWYDSDKAELKM